MCNGIGLRSVLGKTESLYLLDRFKLLGTIVKGLTFKAQIAIRPIVRLNL